MEFYFLFRVSKSWQCYSVTWTVPAFVTLWFHHQNHGQLYFFSCISGPRTVPSPGSGFRAADGFFFTAVFQYQDSSRPSLVVVFGISTMDSSSYWCWFLFQHFGQLLPLRLISAPRAGLGSEPHWVPTFLTFEPKIISSAKFFAM